MRVTNVKFGGAAPVTAGNASNAAPIPLWTIVIPFGAAALMSRWGEDLKLIFNHWQVYDGKHAEATMTPPELTFQYRGTPITRTCFSRIGIF